MIRIFCGFDAREAVGYHVFCASVVDHASAPVAFTPLNSRGLPQGSNEFTFSRFLVPWLCEFEGHALFMDASDMVMLGDVAELDALFDPAFAVQVVQHQNYKTRHAMKYLHTSMQCPNRDYARKNWASVMLMNCEHPYWRSLDHATLNNVAGLSLLQFGGLKPAEVGALPDEWNRIVDEGQPVEGAKVLHWTAGIPALKAYADAPGACHWFEAQHVMNEAP